MPKIESNAEVVDDEELPLVLDEARKYWAIAARLNYLLLDSVDIQYAVKEATIHE